MNDTTVIMNLAIYILAGWLTLTVWKVAVATKMRREMTFDDQQQRFGYAVLMAAGLILGWPIVSLAAIADLVTGQGTGEKLMQVGILAGWLVLIVPMSAI